MKTIDEAVQWVLGQINDVEKGKIRERLRAGETPDQIAGYAHHTFGMYTRNELHLWQDEVTGDLKQSVWDSLDEKSKKKYENWWKGHGDHMGRTMHADDCSHTILTEAVRRMGEGQ